MHRGAFLGALTLIASGCGGAAFEDVAHPQRAPACAFAGPDAPRHLFAGPNSVCALVGAERDLLCWGSNEDGSLHFGGSSPVLDNCRSEAEQAEYRRELEQRRNYSAAHPNISCVVRAPSKYEPLDCALRPYDTHQSVRDLSFGDVNCAVTPEGEAQCWGLETIFPRLRQVEATELRGARRVVYPRLQETAYGLFPGGKVKCGATAERASSEKHCGAKVNPFRSLESRVIQLEADRWSACAVTEDQRLICSGEWPRRTGCALSDRCHHVAPGLRNLRVRRVAFGGERRCAQTRDDEVLCWGQYGPEELRTDAMELPEPVPGLPRVATIAGGGGQACAIAHDGDVYCWGSRAEKIEGLPALCELAGGRGHMCGVATDGSVYCWGTNPSGQLGDGTREDHLRSAVQTLPPGSVVLNGP